jgi:transposase
MSKRNHVVLTSAERSELEQLVRSGACLARVQTKARILLLTDRSLGPNHKDAEIIASLGTSICTIVRTRQAFCEAGLDGALHDRPRSGAPPKMTGDIEAKLTMLACSTPPDGHARWTVRLLADKLVELEYIDQISAVAVHKRLKKMHLSLGSSSHGALAHQVAST